MNLNAPADAPTDDPDLPAAQPADEVDITDVRHLVAVVARWRLLIASGTLFVVGTTVALLFLTLPAYSATSVLLFDQPLGVANGSDGLGVAQKLVSLVPTYAELATTDFALAEVKEQLEIKESLADLRGRVEAEASEGTLLMRITARDPDARAAEDLAAALGQAVKTGVTELQETGHVPAEFQFSITEVSAPHATRPARNELRTVLLAAGFGLAVMAGLAIALEVVFERR